jgi:hypothetical protein
MRREWILLWSLGSAALMVVGAFGPWVTALGILSISGNDVHEHGWYLAALALAGAMVVFARRTNVAGAVWAIVVGLTGTGLTYHDRHDITSLLGAAATTPTQRDFVNALVHVGWGLNVALFASLSLALSGLGWFFSEGERRPALREEARTPLGVTVTNVPTVPAGWYKDPTDASLLRYWNELRLDDADGQARELTEPRQALLPRHRRVRGRGGREHEEPGVAERALLHAELGALAERAAVGLFADERDPARVDALETVDRSREVGAAQVAGPCGRALRGVRQADPLLQQLELLGRLVEPGGETGRVQQPPEIVARVGEVRMRGRGHAPRVDAAEDDPEIRAENVRYGAGSGRAGEAGTASSGRHRKRRLSSVECFVDAGVDTVLEDLAQGLSRHGRRIPRAAGLELDDGDGRLPAAVAPRVALGLRQLPEPPHDLERRLGLGRHLCHHEGMPVVSKELRYAVSLSPEGRFQAEDGTDLDVADSWTAEHLMLAALIRCAIESLRYSARKAGANITEASGSGRALVRKRDSDGRYAVVRADVTLDVAFDPKPERPVLADVLSWAERGCFIGSSLTAKPVYRWNVA